MYTLSKCEELVLIGNIWQIGNENDIQSFPKYFSQNCKLMNMNGVFVIFLGLILI